MAAGRAILRFLWTAWAEEKVKTARRNGYRVVRVLTIFGRFHLTCPRPRRGSLPPIPKLSPMVEFLYGYLTAFFTYREVKGLFRVFLGLKATTPSFTPPKPLSFRLTEPWLK